MNNKWTPDITTASKCAANFLHILSIINKLIRLQFSRMTSVLYSPTEICNKAFYWFVSGKVPIVLWNSLESWKTNSVPPVKPALQPKFIFSKHPLTIYNKIKDFP